MNPAESGDAVLAAVVDQTIDSATARAFVDGDPTCGAVVVFEGVTRADRNPGRGRLVRLRYEAHRSMAEEEMRRLADSAKATWNLGRVAMIHRVGPVDVGETSVIVVVSAGHRGQAFEACKTLIDRLKREVPIWKREVWDDGSETWADPVSEGPPLRTNDPNDKSGNQGASG